jgi:hypothetical protein
MVAARRMDRRSIVDTAKGGSTPSQAESMKVVKGKAAVSEKTTSLGSLCEGAANEWAVRAKGPDIQMPRSIIIGRAMRNLLFNERASQESPTRNGSSSVSCQTASWCAMK